MCDENGASDYKYNSIYLNNKTARLTIARHKAGVVLPSDECMMGVGHVILPTISSILGFQFEPITKYILATKLGGVLINVIKWFRV